MASIDLLLDPLSDKTSELESLSTMAFGLLVSILALSLSVF